MWKPSAGSSRLERAVAVIAVALATALAPLPARALDLPPEVTPALRAACERDVRRLCIGENPTVDKVKACVVRRFVELSTRCKLQIAAAGLAPSGR